MERLKTILCKIKYYRIICIVLVILFLTVALVMNGLIKKGINSLEDQNFYKRWDEKGRFAQISYFIKSEYAYGSDNIAELEYNLEKNINTEGIETEEGSKLFVDCYSGKSNVSISNDSKRMDVNCIAVGGDFFYFHPIKMISGNYFSGDDIMKDGIVIDEQTAWQLFGSSDVAGREVYFGDRAIYIKGVYEREDNKIYSYARGNEPEIFISFELLEEMGFYTPITTLELCIPNPVDNFAAELANKVVSIDASSCEMIENSERFTVESLWNVNKNRKYRAMQNNDVLFPYWEKVARYEEEVLAPYAVTMCVCFVVSGVIAVGLVIYELTNLTRFRKNDHDIE